MKKWGLAFTGIGFALIATICLVLHPFLVETDVPRHHAKDNAVDPCPPHPVQRPPDSRSMDMTVVSPATSNRKAEPKSQKDLAAAFEESLQRDIDSEKEDVETLREWHAKARKQFYEWLDRIDFDREAQNRFDRWIRQATNSLTNNDLESLYRLVFLENPLAIRAPPNADIVILPEPPGYREAMSGVCHEILALDPGNIPPASQAIFAELQIAAMNGIRQFRDPDAYDIIQKQFLKSRESPARNMEMAAALKILVELDKNKAKVWIEGALSDNGNAKNSRSTKWIALNLAKDHYRTEDFIPYIRTIAANHPRPPEIVEDKGQEDIVYRVQDKDTLWSIAEKFYDGRRDLSTVIAEANKETLAGKWGRPMPPKVGQTLRIPRLTKETIADMPMEEFDGLYNSMLETLEAIGTDEARKLIDEIRASEALRHRQDRR